MLAVLLTACSAAGLPGAAGRAVDHGTGASLDAAAQRDDAASTATTPQSRSAPRAAAGPASAATLHAAADPVATVSGARVTLADGLVARTWRIVAGPLGGLVTDGFDDVPHHTHWADPAGTPDFRVTLDGVAVTSAQGWSSVHVDTNSGPGVASVTFTLTTLPTSTLPAGIAVTRTYTLHSGSPTIAVTASLHDGTPLPLRIGAWTLDEITATTPSASAEVDAYRGGSDFTTSFHSAATERGTFDAEGEVFRADAGGAGWFIVAGRRGGVMSRVGAAQSGTTWRTYAGVDPARDLLDLGPITAPGSDDNRVSNPAYPVPVRQRTVLPLGDLDLGTAYTGVYRGGTQEAAAALAAEMLRSGAQALTRSIDLNTFHPWGHGTGLSDANLRPQAALAKQLGIETFMLDDQWQGSSAGDWTWDTARFPLDAQGVPQFVDYLHSLGLNLGLWMSPMEFNPGSATYAAHPDWACTPTGDASAHIQDDSGLGVWDASNPALLAHMTAVIDHAIAAWGVTEFKFDFLTWLDCLPHDYLDYEDSFVAWVHALQRSHPSVAFEIDETNDQRTWPFESLSLGTSWFDNDHTTTPVQKQLHDVWSATPWIPSSSLGVGLYDGTLKPPYTPAFLMPLALLTHLTFWTDLTKIPDADAAETAWWLAWYAQHRADLSGVVFNLTPSSDPLDGSAWAAFQPWNGDHGDLFAFRQGGSDPTLTVSLHGVDPQRLYSLTDVRTGTPLGQFSGAQLSAGLTLTLDALWSAQVISVEPLP